MYYKRNSKNEVQTMYRRAHSCRQAATSGNVDFSLLLQKNATYVIISANGGAIRAWVGGGGVVSPRRSSNDLRSKQSFLKILRVHVEKSGGWSREHVDIE